MPVRMHRYYDVMPDEDMIDNKWGGRRIKRKEKGISEEYDIRREREKLRGAQ